MTSFKKSVILVGLFCIAMFAGALYLKNRIPVQSPQPIVSELSQKIDALTVSTKDAEVKLDTSITETKSLTNLWRGRLFNLCTLQEQQREINAPTVKQDCNAFVNLTYAARFPQAPVL